MNAAAFIAMLAFHELLRCNVQAMLALEICEVV